MQFQRDFNQSQQLGPSVQRLVEMQAMVDERWDEIMLPIKQFLIEETAKFFDGLETILHFLKDQAIDMYNAVVIIANYVTLGAANLEQIKNNTKPPMSQAAEDPFLQQFLYGDVEPTPLQAAGQRRRDLQIGMP